jgi:hypothetical protein
MGVLQQHHEGALLGLVRAKVRWLRAHAKVVELGEVVADGRGGLVRNPWAITSEKAYDQYRRALAEFGATPSSAARVHAGEAGAEPSAMTGIRPFGVVPSKRGAV